MDIILLGIAIIFAVSAGVQIHWLFSRERLKFDTTRPLTEGEIVLIINPLLSMPTYTAVTVVTALPIEGRILCKAESGQFLLLKREQLLAKKSTIGLNWEDLFDSQSPLQIGEEVWLRSENGALRARIKAIKNDRIFVVVDWLGNTSIVPRSQLLAYSNYDILKEEEV